MKVKLLFSFLAIGALVATTLTGCKTTSGGSSPPIVSTTTNGILVVFGSEVSPASVRQTMQVAGIAGAETAISQDTNALPYLQAVVVILDVALNSGQYDPALLQASLQNISVNEAHDPQVIVGINAGAMLYSTFFGSAVSQKLSDISPYMIPALSGFRDGIAMVVGFHTPPPTPSLAPIPPQ